jgi:hypothetical protein
MNYVKPTIVISRARNRLTFSESAQMLGENNYTLDIRPTFIDELDATVRYIEQELRNPPAADRLIEQTYAAIDERLFAPESFEPCYRPPDVKQPYYRIPVGNFEVYYIVRNRIMEVRWFRYSKSVQPLS